MPKSKPTQVITHRIELQEKEREFLERVSTGYAIKNAVIPVAITGGVVGGSYIAYKSAKAFFEWGKDLVDGAIETGKEFGSKAVFGEESVTSKETGQEIENPAHGIPIIGGLFGLGMDIGNETYKWLKPESWGFD
jgi:hypothetical protein